MHQTCRMGAGGICQITVRVVVTVMSGIYLATICVAVPHHEPGHTEDHRSLIPSPPTAPEAKVHEIQRNMSDVNDSTESPIATTLVDSDPTSTPTPTSPVTGAKSDGEEDDEMMNLEKISPKIGSVTLLYTASDPSIQFLPPPPLPSIVSSSASDIPLTLISIAGNSGGTSGSSKNANDIHVDFTRFRYNEENGQLQKIGNTTGVCPANMRFFAVPRSGKIGACDCDYFECSRPLIYSPERNQCFWAWSQGPCPKGEWFVFEKELSKGGVCKKNPCPVSGAEPSSNSFFFQNPEDELCYEAGTQGYCKNAEERLLIYPGDPIPKCRMFTVCNPLSVPQELQCIHGSRYYAEGNCNHHKRT